MIGRTNAGGGGGGLNFKVKAYAALPENGSENEIAVITDTPMSGYVMQAEQPAGVEGLVWIEVAAESDVAFYADKKETIKLYPLRAKQYVNGVYVKVNAYSYMNGAWTSWWGGELYDSGDQFLDITGGWGLDGYSVSGGQGGFTAKSDHLYIQGKDGGYWGFGGTLNAVDLTEFTTLYFDGYCANSSNKIWGVCDEKDGGFEAQANIQSSRQTHSIDISNLDGPHYVCFRTGGSGQIYIYKVWME